MNTITLPRSVVEQALEALKYEKDANNPLDWHHDKTMHALRAALEQPQDHPEQHLDMVPEGWKLVPVKPTEDMLNAVAWPGCAATDWEHMLAAAPQPPTAEKSSGVEQPQGEQEPLFWYRPRRDGLYEGPLHKSQIERVRKESGGWVPLYTRPQPCQPLTDAQINDHRLALPYDGEDLPDPWDFKQGVRAAERAHRIGGEA